MYRRARNGDAYGTARPANGTLAGSVRYTRVVKQETPAWKTRRTRAALSQSAQAPAPEMQRFQLNARGSKRWLGIIARSKVSYRQNQWSCHVSCADALLAGAHAAAKALEQSGRGRARGGRTRGIRTQRGVIGGGERVVGGERPPPPTQRRSAVAGRAAGSGVPHCRRVPWLRRRPFTISVGERAAFFGSLPQTDSGGHTRQTATAHAASAVTTSVPGDCTL